jgi:hypothetical protein
MRASDGLLVASAGLTKAVVEVADRRIPVVASAA